MKNILISNFGSNENMWEREDQNYYIFNANDISISLTYWYDTSYGFESGYTSFSISNYREYPDLLIDTIYENKISIDKYLVFDEAFSINADYKHNPNVKRIPKKIIDLFGYKSAIWIDELNKKIGFSDKNQSEVFDIKQIKNFAIQNVSPARSGGYCYLELHFKNHIATTSIFEGNYQELNKYAHQIEKVTTFKVVFNTEYNDS